MNLGNLTLSTEVNFYISIGYGARKEMFTLEELGFTNESLSTLTTSQIFDTLNELQGKWSWNYLDSGWHFE